MIILGIDPGTATTGYGVVREKSPSRKTKDNFQCLEYGAIITKPTFAAAERLRQINNSLDKIIRKYRPEILVVENIFFFKNLKTAMPVSQAKGVILLTAAKKNVPVFELSPPQIKLLVTGSGKAEKIDVQKKIKSFFNLKEIPKPDDAADALAIALAYSFVRKA
jgi:crossover junction endodeoxyribonuclease RuvC